MTVFDSRPAAAAAAGTPGTSKQEASRRGGASIVVVGGVHSLDVTKSSNCILPDRPVADGVRVRSTAASAGTRPLMLLVVRGGRGRPLASL